MKKAAFHFVVIFTAFYSPLTAAATAAGIVADMSATGEISAGKAIFDRVCANCHRTPTSIQTSTSELRSRLSPGAIRQHRFQLSDAELAQVIEYIKSVRP